MIVSDLNVQYAAVMGISKDLKLTKNDFSNVGSAFFIAYLVAEVPTGPLPFHPFCPSSNRCIFLTSA